MRKQDGYRVIVGVSKNIVGRYHCTAAEIDFDSFHNSYSLLVVDDCNIVDDGTFRNKQGCTNRCSLAAGLRGNEERMRK